MIERLLLKNFKAFAEADLSLKPLTVLVGPNGSGKTTLLFALDRLSALARDAANGKTSRAAFNREEDSAPEDLVRRGAGSFELAANLVLGSGQAPTVLRVTGSATPSDTNAYLNVPGKPEQTLGTGDLDEATRALGRSAFLRLNAREAAASSFPDEVRPQMSPGGVGLASVLAFLKLRYEEEFEEISNAMRQVVPHVTRIRLDRVGKLRQDSRGDDVSDPADIVVFDTKGASAVRAHEAGEGTILVPALLTRLLLPPRPTLLLLDDLELALHPRAQETLVTELRKLLARFADLQIVATSHSPFVLDCLNYDEVPQTVLAETGEARAGELVNHPEYARWREQMRPGEFWSTVGEQWLARAPQGPGQ